MERTEVLNHLRENKGGHHIIVTYPEALFEKVINPETLKEQMFEIAVGDKLDIDFMIEFLAEFNFDRTDFVYEAGSFSIRGGIIDVFSFANDLPYRIQLDDDKVESIRMFDPETQLSARRLTRLTIIPNVEEPTNNKNRIPFLDFLSPNTLILAQNFTYVAEVLHQLQKKLKTKLKDEEALSFFDDHKNIMKTMERFSCISLGGDEFFKSSQSFEMKISPQPDFNKNFDLLAANLKRNEDNKYQNIIFSDQPKQVERLYAIFEDLRVGVHFTPIYKTLHEGFIDDENKIACYTEHQVFGRYQRYKTKKAYSRNEAISLKELYELKPGDYVTHLDYGVGIFSGLEKIEAQGKQQEAVRLKYKGGDLLYVNIHSLHKITRFVGAEGKEPKLNKLGTNTWETLKNKTKKQVKDIARDLIALYAKRRTQNGFAFSRDSYMQTELEASFIYEDTPDQAKATIDFKRDMEASYPMDRLICGDVGFGKTEIAIRAAFKAVADNKQVAVLVPTTILALQHYKTFKARLQDFPCTVDFISRFKTAAQAKETLRKVTEGKVDILIGTHRILSKDLKFKDVGLLIIDEEQKFGVQAKEKLRSLKTNIDTLFLTATPIPRTLQFSLMGARDMSVINTPPPNRQPVNTRVEVYNTDTIRDAVDAEISRGGQVFFVHNRIKDIFEMGDMIKRNSPHAKVAVAHAQMESHILEETMLGFVDGYFDVLVSTNIVESGLDIANANTIIINQAQNFGLSDLYQLRGRVGRSNKKAYCYLLIPPMSVVTSEARKRLAALEEHTALGSGFHIAMKDLDIRGAGNMLGAEQSGFIAEIGLEMFQKILDEALTELKEDEFKELFNDEENPTPLVRDTQIDTDLEILIPDEYVGSVNERLNLYNKIGNLKTHEDIVAFIASLEDRFGKLPKQVNELLRSVELKFKAKDFGVEKITLKNNRMRLFFTTRAEGKFFNTDKFGAILSYLQLHPIRCKLTQTPSEVSLQINEVRTVREALMVFEELGG
ncbi:MAG: transcription-repair coupling factor [Bacteroidetes bacterium]|nr:transcription-repair coupling factor [Bacteroidota bacterium]